MIRHGYSEQQISAAVTEHVPGWIQKAALRTKKLKAAKKYTEPSAIWSEVKLIYIHLQGSKCVFCERKFESPEYGKIEHDLEHFRPKSGVKTWPTTDLGLTYPFGTGNDSAKGYYWLAYELMNYAASCKVCNSVCKSNFFPISGARKTVPGTLSALTSEKPYLCYPIGTEDKDPEDLVTFSATTAVPTRKSGEDHKRGRVIIDFFKLNQREQLHRERSFFIVAYAQAKSLEDASIDSAENHLFAKRLLLPVSPHAACTRAFSRLWNNDKATAKIVFRACRDYLSSVIPHVPPAP